MYAYVDGKQDPNGNITVRTATYVPAPAGYTGTKYREATSQDPSYVFLGWYKEKADGSLESTPYDFNNLVTGPITIKAKWSNRRSKVTTS